jgi:hypothetical protein
MLIEEAMPGMRAGFPNPSLSGISDSLDVDES